MAIFQGRGAASFVGRTDHFGIGVDAASGFRMIGVKLFVIKIDFRREVRNNPVFAGNFRNQLLYVI